MARLTHFLFGLSAWLLASRPVSAEPMLFSDSLNSCQANNSFSATTFDVTLTPNNNSVSFLMKGNSTIKGYINAELNIYVYGYRLPKIIVDPCTIKNFGLCPMEAIPLDMPRSNLPVSADALKKVPAVAYAIPDLDATVQVYFNLTGANNTGRPAVACVEAHLSNGKTVNQKGVAWITAVIAGLALIASAVTSGLGHSNTAAHVAANAMALFAYFQAQAFIGMMAVPMPPIVSSWTQNFQWTMGIIRVQFLQDLATWYQRATGGTPATILSTLTTKSVQLERRGLNAARAVATTADTHPNNVVIRGIERVGFKAGIESTNIFLTGYIFFLVFVMLVVLGVLIFKVVVDALVKAGKMQNDKFQDFRNGWTTVLKGIVFRVVLIGYPQMVVLCFWEFTRNKTDSAAETTLAFFTIFTMFVILVWASSKVIRLARRSIGLHGNPAYILYSDPVSLNKWGFIYVQFRAAAYYFIVPTLIYILIKGLFVALVQSSGVAQAVALILLETAFLITVCVLRPFMDKKVNAFNISICVINFLNSICVLVFSEVFNQPRIVTGVMGVIFFVYNVVFSTVLLVIVLVASVMAIVSKNPDTRYAPMQDDRGNFAKSQTNLTTELDALGAPIQEQKSKSPFDDDKEAPAPEAVTVQAAAAPVSVSTYPAAAPALGAVPDNRRMPPPRSPQPMQQRPPPQQQAQYQQRGPPQQRPPPQRMPQPVSQRSFPQSQYSSGRPTPPPFNREGSGESRHRPPPSRQQTASPWQRGAGYD